MRKLAFLFVAFALVTVSFYGCDESPTALPEDNILTPNPTLDAVGAAAFEVERGAIVFNSGNGKPGINCRWGSYTTHEGSIAVTPSGNWKIDCQFRDLPAASHAVLRDWYCTLCVSGQGCEHSYESLWVRTKNRAHSYCHFNGNLRWDG